VRVFVVRRLALSVLALLGVLVVMFLIMHVAPVDPARQYAGIRATPGRLVQLCKQLGPDGSLPAQQVFTT
jgi:peptide/nickel transport system permease protein